MPRLIIGSLSLLLMSVALAPAVRAEMPRVNSSDSTVENSSSAQEQEQTTAFNLVTLAYQGFFQKQGIPSAGALLQGYRAGDIRAEDLVRSGIAVNRLAPETLNDQEYMAAVKSYLTLLVNNGASY